MVGTTAAGKQHRQMREHRQLQNMEEAACSRMFSRERKRRRDISLSSQLLCHR
jgi:hypothetical protein